MLRYQVAVLDVVLIADLAQPDGVNPGAGIVVAVAVGLFIPIAAAAVASFALVPLASVPP
jgi:hypothetical protein